MISNGHIYIWLLNTLSINLYFSLKEVKLTAYYFEDKSCIGGLYYVKSMKVRLMDKIAERWNQTKFIDALENGKGQDKQQECTKDGFFKRSFYNIANNVAINAWTMCFRRRRKS